MTPPDNAQPATGLTLADADVPTLIAIWLGALDSFGDVAASLSEAQWNADSPCPGWSAGDVVAHVLALESELHGEPVPEHEPPWDELPHITTPLGRYMEVPVDWRRTKERDIVVAELREIIEWRRQDLATMPSDPDELVTGPAGWQSPRERFIKTRILDTWIHEQDIRKAADLPGGLNSPAAWVTGGQLAKALPRAWGKGANAPAGATLHLSVTGPGVHFDERVLMGDDGRAAAIEGASTGDATVTVRMTWPTLVLLAGGRIGAIASAHNGGAQLNGDMELANRLLAGLTSTP
ncbi:MAG: maleylpyruvate isomerase family mycothiol-dependent enzyme [Candidatus Nanopelagicales bacterium]